MKQVVMRGGAITVAEVPAPIAHPGRVLVATAASVISSGTERATMAQSGGSLPQRAIRNPDLVKKALDMARERGVKDTLDRVRAAASDDSPLGYSSAGIVLDTGGIPDFRTGQLVACAGAGKANHAEVVSVPGNLTVPAPEGVSARDAAFATLGSIALQGVRRAEPTLGERVVVVGLGLLGQLTVQLLRASGCEVFGVEPVADRRALAERTGAARTCPPAEAKAQVEAWTQGIGADAVVVAASTPSDAVINDSIAMLRRKGRVVPVGDVGFNIDRSILYPLEADVLISTSYGPGRYDPTYEEAGLDYPIGYVRWTENRNMEAFLRLVGSGAVQLDPLIGLEMPVEQAPEAYAAVNGEEPPLAAVLTYDAEARAAAGAARETINVNRAGRARAARNGHVKVALVGPGAFLRSTHVPVIKKDPKAQVVSVVARTGTTATDVARAVGGARATTDWGAAIEDADVDLLVIGTRHDSHAEIAAAGLRAGKAVFVEKPLGLTQEEIDDVWDAGGEDAPLAIGFNRPFAPLAVRMREQVDAASGPLHVHYRVSAPLPAGHWLNDPREGGGRLLGEGCHMFDFTNWLCGTPVRVHAAALPAAPGVDAPESTTVTIEYSGGSVASVMYSGVGAKSMPKERVEVLRGGRGWVLDDYTRLESFGDGAPGEETGKQDKGHAALMTGVLAAARGEGPWRPGLGAAYLAQAVGLAALESLRTGGTADVLPPS